MKNVLISIAGFFLITLCGTAAAGELTRSEAAAWLDGYKSAWENRDADKVVTLFTENATYQDNPHNEPYKGREGIREYWTGVTKDQRDVSFQFSVLTTYDRTAIARWSADFTSASSGATIRLDGVFLLEFDGSGLCRSLREWWHVKVEEAEQKE